MNELKRFRGTSKFKHCQFHYLRLRSSNWNDYHTPELHKHTKFHKSNGVLLAELNVECRSGKSVYQINRYRKIIFANSCFNKKFKQYFMQTFQVSDLFAFRNAIILIFVSQALQSTVASLQSPILSHLK